MISSFRAVETFVYIGFDSLSHDNQVCGIAVFVKSDFQFAWEKNYDIIKLNCQCSCKTKFGQKLTYKV